MINGSFILVNHNLGCVVSDVTICACYVLRFSSMKKALPWITLTLTIVATVLFLVVDFDDPLYQSLLLSRSNGFDGFSWLSGQFLHTDWNHFIFDVFAFLILGYCIESHSRIMWMVTLILGFSSMGIWFWYQTEFNYYAGLSGALNCFLVVALYSLRDTQSLFRGNGLLWLLFIGALIKNLVEFKTGGALFSSTRWRSTPSFHLVGQLVGVFIVLVLTARNLVPKRSLSSE